MMNKKDKPEAGKPFLALLARGVVILLPVFVIGLAVAKMIGILHDVVRPALDAAPGLIFKEPAVRLAAVILALLTIVLLIGLLSEMPLGKAIGRRAEVGFLNRIPFYALLRKLSTGLAGANAVDAPKPVLVEVNPGIRQLGFVMERNADGSCSVFLPSAPNTGSGAVLVVGPELISDVAAAGHKVLGCLHKLGYGIRVVISDPDNGKNR